VGNAFIAQRAGMAEYDVAGFGNMLIELQRPRCPAEQFGKGALAFLKGRPAQVSAGKLKQIKSEQHGFRLGLAAVTQPVKNWGAVLAADHHLAIDQAGAAG
jgi:hypothetical protein